MSSASHRSLRAGIFASTLLAACEELPAPASNPGECPPGPQAPLGARCAKQDQQCRYGYDPIECGGRTLICVEGIFEELEHTDPAPTCGGAPEIEVACGRGTWDCGSESIARTVCEATPDCEVCPQIVDEVGNATVWVAFENASVCECPAPQVAPRGAGGR